MDGSTTLSRLVNPAADAPAVAALFPAGVLAAELSAPGPSELLTPAEWQSIRHCHPARIADFTAGRLCARLALARRGVEGFSLLPGADRQPRWPAGIVGSITHTDGYAAAVAAPRDRVGSLGLDSIRVDALERRLWAKIGTAEELEALATLTVEASIWQAALLLAAKEAFFKCQYPLTRELLGFDAVQIGFTADRGQVGTFSVVPRRPLRLDSWRQDGRVPLPCGRWRCHGAYVTAGIALPPGWGTAGRQVSR